MSVYSDQFFDQQSAGSLASARVVLKVLFDIGRDAATPALEARVDQLRTMVIEKSNEAELLNGSLERVRSEPANLRNERDQLAQENAAMRASTSWRITIEAPSCR